MAPFTRRQLAKVFVGIAATGTLRGDEPMLSVSGVDHLKLRVASAGASAMFYYDLFGGDIVSVRNSTLPDSPRVDEFFLKIGVTPFPYLMLSQITPGELPGLDHLAVLADNPVAMRPVLERNGISLINPAHGLRVRDADGTLIELVARPTWGGTAQSIRLALPTNLRGVRPAFEPVAVKRLCLRTVDVDRSAHFYSQLFGRQGAQSLAAGGTAFTYGATVLELRPIAGGQPPGLDRLIIAVRNLRLKQARRILQQRGIQPYGSKHEVLFRDPDGNEMELAVP